MAVGEQYRSFVRRQNVEFSEDDFRLYIKEISSGSIIAQLVDYATQTSILTPLAPLIVQYANSLSNVFDALKGVKEISDVSELLGFSKRDYQQISQMIEPAVRDNGSQMNFVVRDDAHVVVNIGVDTLQANAIQNGARRRIEGLPESLTGIHVDQVLYWYQVRDDKSAKPGDKAVIERISQRPVKIRFSSEGEKRKMLDMPENPFRKLFIVDVDVTETEGKPVLYRILDVKDSFDRPD